METRDLKVGDRVRVKNSITGTITEITENGWIKVSWLFVNDGKLIGFPEREMQIDGFRASQIECIIGETT